LRAQNDLLFFFFRFGAPEARQTGRKKEAGCGVACPRAAARLRFAPAGLALGWYDLALSARQMEPPDVGWDVD